MTDKKPWPDGATVGSVTPEYTISIGNSDNMTSPISITTATLDTDYVYDTASTITLTSPSYDDTVTFDVGSDYYNQDFVDTMPSVHKIDEMCKEYPALGIVYNKFKSMYKMCEQDYKGKLKEQGLDDDIPF